MLTKQEKIMHFKLVSMVTEPLRDRDQMGLFPRLSQ
jgi:hypothetical protein